jgi:hypothetical protein
MLWEAAEVIEVVRPALARRLAMVAGESPHPASNRASLRDRKASMDAPTALARARKAQYELAFMSSHVSPLDPRNAHRVLYVALLC